MLTVASDAVVTLLQLCPSHIYSKLPIQDAIYCSSVLGSFAFGLVFSDETAARSLCTFCRSLTSPTTPGGMCDQGRGGPCTLGCLKLHPSKPLSMAGAGTLDSTGNNLLIITSNLLVLCIFPKLEENQK